MMIEDSPWWVALSMRKRTDLLRSERSHETWDVRERRFNLCNLKERQPTRFNFSRPVDWMKWRSNNAEGGMK